MPAGDHFLKEDGGYGDRHLLNTKTAAVWLSDRVRLAWSPFPLALNKSTISWVGVGSKNYVDLTQDWGTWQSPGSGSCVGSSLEP